MSVDEKEWTETLSHYGKDSAAAAADNEKESTAGSATTATATSGLPSAEEALVGNNADDNIDNHNKEEVEVVVVPKDSAAAAAHDVKAAAASASEAEVFRIGGDAKKMNETALVKAAPKATTTSTALSSSTDGTVVDNTNNTTDALRAGGKIEANVKEWGVVTLEVQEIVGNVCVVFPSAITFPAEARMEPVTGHVPYVTLHPSFMKKKGAGNAAKALDNIFKTVSSSSSGYLLSNDFLAEEMVDEKIDAVEKMCLGRLRALLHHAADNKAQVLLFLILLVRIEVAIYLAFRKTMQFHHKRDNNNNNNNNNSSNNAGNNNHNSPDWTPGRLDCDKLEALVAQLENLSKLAQTLDKSKLNSIMSPMISTGHCSLGGNRTKGSDAKVPQNLLLTPLPALVRIFSTAEASSKQTFKAWDNAWTNSLRRFSDYAKSYPVTKDTTPNKSSPPGSEPKTPNNNENTDWMDTTTATPSPTATAGSNSKNKKKRRNKPRKRGRKNSTNGNNGADDVAATTTNNNSTNSIADAATPDKDATTTEGKGAKHGAEEAPVKQEAPKKKGGNHHPPKENKNAKGPAAQSKKASKETPPAESRTSVASTAGAVSTETNAKGADAKKANSNSPDAKKLPLSVSAEETTSTRTESTKHHDELEAESANKRTSKGKGDLSGSRVQQGVVVVALSTGKGAKPASAESEPEGTKKPASATANAAASEDHNDDEWETVVVGKGRGNRKKTGRSPAAATHSPSANAAAPQNHQNQNHNSGGGGPKKSKSRRTKESRRRVANGKMVREILSSVLDAVDEEVKKRKQQQQARVVKNVGGNKAPPSAWKEPNKKLPAVSNKKDAMRDVVAGEANKSPPTSAKSESGSEARNAGQQGAGQKAPGSARTAQKSVSASPAKGTKGQTAGADQNTAPTIPETVSAVSDPRRRAPNKDIDITRSDSSSTGTDDNRKPDQAAVPVKKNASPAPPLPTLLSPGNVNSASSSVASSLEAPHASHGRHHTSTSNEADVGYHLLDVCDRLTRDMHMFMAHRAAALSARRRERGALLAALQDSVSAIWTGHSHVELYGSCATLLDLPSSDLDVVVCGLDHMEAAMNNQASPQRTSSFSSENMSPDKMPHDHQQLGHRHSHPQYVPMHLNADRVMRLAAELELQPWAAHVKAIPTASVPVVKVLADPSRLPGATPHSAVDGEEWMMQQARDPNGAPVAMASSGEAPQTNGPHFEAPMSTPVWRGADVINGLLKLDITFEGPEHGGIGSTEFSARVIQNVCEETGLAAESTAFVQVVLVVKELLAQRRLNEPFSGGLSSYALLLLVLAVLCERKVISEELERVERQRRVVAAGGGNSELTGTPNNQMKQAEKVSPQPDQSQAKPQQKQGGPAAVDSKATADMTVSGVATAKNNTGGNSSPKPQQHSNQNAKQQKQPKHPHQNSAAQPQEKRAQTGNQQRGGKNQKGTQPNAGRGAADSSSSAEKPAKTPGNSWASIAMGKKNKAGANSAAAGKNHNSQQKKSPQPNKPSSFADAVARNAGSPPVKTTPPTATPLQTPPASQPQPKQGNEAPNKGANANYQGKKAKQKQNQNQSPPAEGENQTTKTVPQKTTKKSTESVATAKQQNRDESSKETITDEPERKIEADEKTSKFNNYSSEPVESPAISSNQSVFPQGFNDVIEVLCSGETTPGKLLMHVLLFYGQHFDAHATAIDISGKHHREIATQCPPYTHLSPYIQRRSAGNIDPVTGMLTVDPIVVYDPLEGAENNNVARRCFLWSSVKWTFAQSYMTLSSAVERNTTPPGTPSTGTKNEAKGAGRTTDNNARQSTNNNAVEGAAWNGPYNPTDKENFFDPSSPLLELLLSFK
ncbi:Nucleotidyltransferase domain [Seminavis robusta]|uniref:Nucleotidyltransferase domain n=1 Tax=Seminavis robusta TaxID=568900 RepID=A0A9N8HCB1_9STRA|nr:Nucleotidyltransferase domain [Seminavis robusta]|eukprot:Sro294_g110240.1 Nucleotidyltransferase domain (1847) ;mRNA; f:39180-44905